MVVEHGTCGRLPGGIIDENQKGLNTWISKHNYYAEKEMRDLLAGNHGTTAVVLQGKAKRQRWLKENLYLSAPPFFRAFAYWFVRYFVLLGILDGRPGMIYHFLQGFWYRFLADAKVYEARINGDTRGPRSGI